LGLVPGFFGMGDLSAICVLLSKKKTGGDLSASAGGGRNEIASPDEA
jgi:hypothetical protein